MGLGELQLESRHQIYVETQTQGRAVVGAATGLRGEEVVRLLKCAALVTRVRRVAPGAVAHLHKPGITVMRPGMTGEVLVAEDMKLGDVFPAVGVVGGVRTVTPHPRGIRGRRERRVLVQDTRLKDVHTDLEAVE